MKKIFLSAVITLLSLFCFTACYDAIFQAIRDEVELESATISGYINGIARYNVNPSEGINFDNQYLFLANGSVYYKKASELQHGAWNKLSGNGLPSTTSYAYFDGEFKGIYIYKVAADADHVYAIGFKPLYDDDNSRNVPRDYVIYATSDITQNEDGSLSVTWEEVTGLTDVFKTYLEEIDAVDDDNYGMALSIHLFCSNAVNPEHRAAFVRVGGGTPYLSNSRNYTSDVYKLEGSTFTKAAQIVYDSESETTSFTEGGSDLSSYHYSELTRNTLSVLYFGDGFHFMNYLNADTNEGTLDENGDVLTSPTYVYFPGYSSYICSFAVVDYNSATFTDIFTGVTTNPTEVTGISSVSAGSSILSIAVTNDSILLGSGRNRATGGAQTSGDGVFRVALTNGQMASSTSDFETNADSVMVDPYSVRSLICADPSLNETETSLYSSIDYIYTESTSGTSIKNRGLWSYYASRGNWNRE